MKTRVIITSAPAAVIGGLILLLGCGAQSQKTALNESDQGVAAEDPVPTAPANPAAAVQSVPKAVPAPPKLSPGVDEIVQLAQAGVGDEVLQAYIENSPVSYKLDVDEILYLHDVGLSAETIAAMVRHQGQAPPESATNPPAAAPATAQATDQPVPAGQAADTNAAPPPADASSAYAVTPPLTPPVNYNYFYQTLAPYGSWVDVADYGWCWQPTVAVIDSGWRPYCNSGRWLWTDSGWYWQSDYSWGWAPFHYGRWYRSPIRGWVWVPDTTWGPAWVTWRYSDAYCGWAPLPPRAYFDAGFGFRFGGRHVGFGFDFGLASDCYAFIPTAFFCDHRPWRHCLPSSRIVAVFNHTTVINHYAVGPTGHTIMNVGPGRNAIASVTRTEIRKVALRDVNPTGSTLIRADRLGHDGKTLAVFRPKLPPQSVAPPPEITHRQQESRKRSEALVQSDAVKRASPGSDRKALIAPSGRISTDAGRASRGTPLSAPRVAGRGADANSSRNAETPSPRTPVISANPRQERRNSGNSASYRSESAPRPLAEVLPGETRNREERSSISTPAQNNSREIRSEPVHRQPSFSVEPRSGFQSQSRPQVITPPVSSREGRRFESPAFNYSRPPAGTPPSSVVTPRAVEPRSSAPAYRPPQTYSPPPAARRSFEAPVARPSSPAPSYSPPPASRPAPSPPPAVSRSQPSSGSSQSRSEGRRR